MSAQPTHYLSQRVRPLRYLGYVSNGSKAEIHLRLSTQKKARRRRRAQVHSSRNGSGVALVPSTERFASLVLDASPCVLELAFGLVSLPVAFHLLVTEQLARAFLHLAAGLLEAAVSAIVVNSGSSAVVMSVVLVHRVPPFSCEGSTLQPFL